MKNIAAFIFVSFALTALLLAGCNQPAATGNSANNANNNTATIINTSNPANTVAKKIVTQELPPTMTNADIKLLDGTTTKLKDQKGKIILVNLWATWCGPCRQEMPELIKIQDEYKDKGVMVLGLDVDPESETAVKNFVEKQGLNYTVGWATEDVANAMLEISKMGGIPQSFLIAQDGKLARIFKGYNPVTMPNDVRRSIDELLAPPAE
jgi:thiol-disulfide isomerase/thioredoxin